MAGHWEIRYTYIAAKPIKAEHPVGSGTMTVYQPGEEIPAGEWGRAADNLCEVGKAFRTAINVWVEDDEPASGGEDQQDADDLGASVLPESLEDDDPEGDVEPVEYPVKQDGGFYLLSDGTTVRGKAKALASQATLDVSAES